MNFRVGQYVAWAWGNGQGTGKIVERFEDDVTRKISGTEVKRKASADEPAFLIEQDDGDQVLKSCSVVTSA
jgi:hypothetical protein